MRVNRQVKAMSWDVSFGPCDPLNPGFGYEIRIEKFGRTVLNTNRHPVTGEDLDYHDCVKIAAMYGPKMAEEATAVAS